MSKNRKHHGASDISRLMRAPPPPNPAEEQMRREMELVGRGGHRLHGGREPAGSKLVEILKQNEINEKQVLGMELPNSILKYLTMEEIRDLKDMFDMYDIDRSDFVSLREFHSLVQLLGFDVTLDECRHKLKEIENQPRELVSFASLLFFVIDPVRKSGNTRDVYDELTRCFDSLTTDEGKLTKESLMQVCKDYGLVLSNKDVADMLNLADQNGDGVVDQEEFVALMKKSNLF